MVNKVIYDWVSVTSKIHNPQGLIALLGLDHEGIVWEQVKGAHGYRDRLYWEKISIHYNGREDMGIWLEMSGQGCRAFESFGTGGRKNPKKSYGPTTPQEYQLFPFLN